MSAHSHTPYTSNRREGSRTCESHLKDALMFLVDEKKEADSNNVNTEIIARSKTAMVCAL